MSRAIDADALKARMYHEAFETDADMQRWDSGCWIRYKMFEEAIAEAPTIEPERKKGRWINHRCDDGHNIADCSLCGNSMQWFDPDPKPNFCPDCGAYMRGEKSD